MTSFNPTSKKGTLKRLNSAGLVGALIHKAQLETNETHPIIQT